MAREKITEKLQAEFDKPHFQIGAAVFFSWLGAKKYGHVTTFKKTNWGIQYTVRSFKGTSYPCGISIDGSTTSYKVGIIYSEETRKLGDAEIASRIRTEIENNRISTNTRRSEVSSTTHNTGSGPIVNIDNIPATDLAEPERGTMSSHEPSNTRVSNRNTKTRKPVKSALDEVIEKQKNFLNGFVKKD